MARIIKHNFLRNIRWDFCWRVLEVSFIDLVFVLSHLVKALTVQARIVVCMCVCVIHSKWDVSVSGLGEHFQRGVKSHLFGWCVISFHWMETDAQVNAGLFSFLSKILLFFSRMFRICNKVSWWRKVMGLLCDLIILVHFNGIKEAAQKIVCVRITWKPFDIDEPKRFNVIRRWQCISSSFQRMYSIVTFMKYVSKHHFDHIASPKEKDAISISIVYDCHKHFRVISINSHWIRGKRLNMSTASHWVHPYHALRKFTFRVKMPKLSVEKYDLSMGIVSSLQIKHSFRDFYNTLLILMRPSKMGTSEQLIGK